MVMNLQDHICDWLQTVTYSIEMSEPLSKLVISSFFEEPALLTLYESVQFYCSLFVNHCMV